MSPFCRDSMEVGFAKKINYDCTLGIVKGIKVGVNETVNATDADEPLAMGFKQTTIEELQLVDKEYLAERNKKLQAGIAFTEKHSYEFVPKRSRENK